MLSCIKCNLKTRIVHSWYQKNFYSFLLYPLSLIYRMIIFLRRCAYRVGLLKTHFFAVPIVVVGNITVGGTGKTPFIIALAEYFVANGFQPGIVSRGYGGQAKQWPQPVTSESSPKEVGDEPVLIAKKTHCKVMVAPRRVLAVEALIAQGCDVILSDDGLQHYAMARDVEIVLWSKAHLGNGFCLPAGPLREPKARLKKVTYLLEKGSAQYQVVIGKPYSLIDNSTILKPGRIHALCGIAQPEPFFQALIEQGFTLITHVFPDHHAFTPEDFAFLPTHEEVVMTEKDAVKCEHFADSRFYALPMTAVIDPLWLTELVQNL